MPLLKKSMVPGHWLLVRHQELVGRSLSNSRRKVSISCSLPETRWRRSDENQRWCLGCSTKIYAWENRFFPRSWRVNLFGILINWATKSYRSNHAVTVKTASATH